MDSHRLPHAPARPRAGLRTLGRGAMALGLLAAGACADDAPTTPVRAPGLALRSAGAAAIVSTTGPQSGVDCGCTRTGGYASPSPGKAVPAGGETRSPNGVYTAAMASGGNLHVYRGSTEVAWLGGLPANTSWAFSPDDHRLVYHYWSGTAPNLTHHVYLRDLAVSGTPLVAQFDEATTAARIAFSPHGRHLLYARRASSTSTTLTVLDAPTGAIRYAATFNFQVAAGSGTDSLGMSASGFSPDDGDRTLAYRYATGSTSAQWNVVNLVRGQASALVLSESVPAGGVWQFSPCGDVLALAPQPSASQIALRLVRTVDGATVVGSAHTLAVSTLAFRSTLADHIVAVNAVDMPRLAYNSADDACTSAIPTLSAVTFSPSPVRGGTTASCTVTLSGPAPAGGLLVDLTNDRPGLATVPTSITVPAGSVSASAPVPTTAVTATTVALITGTANGIMQTGALIVNPVPVISFNPTSLTFASLAVGSTSSPQPVYVRNNGAIALTISGLATSGDFGWTSDCPLSPATLAPGTFCTVQVKFTPTAGGTRGGALTVTTDVPGSPHVIPLSGTGYVPTAGISVASGMDFGGLTLGTTYNRQLRVTSNGTAPLTIASATVSPANQYDFSIAADGCSGQTLAPGAYCIITVNFEPALVGARSATLTIAHDAPGGSSAVALTGSGVKPKGGYIP